MKQIKDEERIEKLGISTKSTTALKRAGILIVGQLTQKTEKQVSEILGIGKRSVEDIKNRLEIFNRTLSIIPNEDGSDLYKLKLSGRSYNALRRANISRIEQLENCTEKDLVKVPNIGEKSINEILTKFQEFKFGNTNKKVEIKIEIKLQEKGKIVAIKQLDKEEFEKLELCERLRECDFEFLK